MDGNFVWLACFVLVAYTTQAMTGFGSVIIAVTLGSNFYPLETLLPVLVPLDVLLNTYIVTRHRRHVDRELLFRGILPLMVVGLLVGIGVFQLVRGSLLERVFGLFVTVLCTRELVRVLRNRTITEPLSRVRYALYVLGAGLVQGVFASGGPLVVYAVSRIDLPKARFRSTLSGLWLVTNIVLTVSYVVTGRFTAESARAILSLLPLVILGLVLGERLHDHVNERLFRITVYAVLIVAGLSILLGV